MKRIVPLALACLILVFSLAAPAQAAEVSTYSGLNLLDYGFPNGLSSPNVTIHSGDTIRFDFPYDSRCAYVDVLLVATGAPITGCVATIGSNRQFSLSIVSVGNNMVRIYGNLGLYYSNYITFTYTFGTSADAYLSYLKVDLHTSSYSKSVDLKGFCQISTSNFNDIIQYNASDVINERYFMGASDVYDCYLNLYLYNLRTDWKPYDYLDYQVWVDCGNITSISASIGSLNIPCEYSIVLSNVTNTGSFIINVRLDLTGIDRNIDDSPQVIIQGQAKVSALNTVMVLNMSGFVEVPTPNTFTYYFQTLKSWLEKQTYEITTAIRGDTSSGDAFKEESSSLVSGLGDISSSMDAVQRPSMDSINMDFTADIGSGTLLVGSLFSELFSVSWLATVFMASIVIALISYILYGKD